MLNLLELRADPVCGAAGSIAAHPRGLSFETQLTARKLSKSMEIPADSRFFESAEDAVAVFAAAGLHQWLAKPVAIASLLELHMVQRELAKLAAGDEPDAEAQHDAVIAAIAAAMRVLREPFYSAARDHFGFTDTEKPLGKVDREKKAARNLGRTSQAWYYNSGRSRAYLNKTPSEYVIALVAAALCGAEDPGAFLANRVAAPPVDGETPDLLRPDRRVRRAGMLVALAVLLVVIGVGAWRALSHDGPGTHATVPMLADVNATTGRISRLASTGTAATTAGVVVGPACVEVIQKCDYPLDLHGIQWDIGNTVHFVFPIVARGTEGSPPVPAVKITAREGVGNGVDGIGVTLTWRVPGKAGGPIKSSSVTAWASVRFEVHRDLYLKYVPGSAALSGELPNGHSPFFTRIPNGILGSQWFTLSDLPVQPGGCSDCYSRYVRVLTFSMSVV